MVMCKVFFMIKFFFKASLILGAFVTLSEPFSAWGTTGEKVIRYKGEADTNTGMEIRISPDGKTYLAKFKSGKFEYKCQPGKVSAEVFQQCLLHLFWTR